MMAQNGKANVARFLRSWAMSNASGNETATERSRRIFKDRFGNDRDWLRVVFLGVILITLSTVAIADALADEHPPGHFGGSSAIFGGIAVVLFVVKIARGALYWDWLLSAVLYFLAGLALSWDENLTSASSLFCVCSLMISCGAIRIWIGLTAFPEEGASWILCSGLVDVCTGLWIALLWLLSTQTTVALIFAFDTLFQGMAIAGYGLSLKEER
ncbi:hypothetical protein ACSHT2_06670 [Bradyrhizobium sp. PUT101]|uniref:hypothetical protein n=1 Tax=Bradyrhizobium sp. PUT101 TaxID=3447427 RepID=UPI003F86EA77